MITLNKEQIIDLSDALDVSDAFAVNSDMLTAIYSPSDDDEIVGSITQSINDEIKKLPAVMQLELAIEEFTNTYKSEHDFRAMDPMTFINQVDVNLQSWLLSDDVEFIFQLNKPRVEKMLETHTNFYLPSA